MKHKACSQHTHRKFGLGKYLSILNRIQLVREKNAIADEEKYRSNIMKGSLSIRNYPRRGWGGEQLKHARLDQVNMQNASKQKKILAEGSKLMKDEDSFLREERGKWETCKMWWWTQTGTFLMSVIEQGWSVDGKIGQCKQSSRQPLCLERKMVGAGHSSQLRATGALSCMQGYPRGGSSLC